MELHVVRVCGGVVYVAVGGTRLVFNQEAPLPVGGGEKHFYMGERFVDRRPLVPLSTISRKNACVENDLVCIVDHFLGGVRRGAGVGIRDCVIDIPPDNLNGFGGGICLAEEHVVQEPVGV